MSSGKVTMKEVADRAGVSKMTVSAVINNDPRIRISDSTRERVLAVARQMGYQPNAIARSLRKKRTDIIGFYSGHPYLEARNPFHADIISGLLNGCNFHHKDLLLHGIYRGMSVEDIYAELADGQIDGLVILPAHSTDPLVERLAASHLPVIAIVDAVPSLPSVVVDDADGARQIVNYLILEGHRHIIYRNYNEAPVSVVRRRNAFMESAARHGLEVAEWTGGDRMEASDPFFATLSQAAISQRPTVIVCWNDSVAYQMRACLRRNGLRVPQDVAVIGFDGISSPVGADFQMTTISANWLRVAQTAIDLLVAHLDGQELGAETMMPVEFIAGDTA